MALQPLSLILKQNEIDYDKQKNLKIIKNSSIQVNYYTQT